MEENLNKFYQNIASHNEPRILVLEALLEIKSPITVDDLQKKLKNKVAKSTLYRVLNDLKTINFKRIYFTR